MTSGVPGLPSALRLGCCAYSFRDQLTGKAEPRMSLFDFLKEAARCDCDGVELTAYYFQVEPTYTELRKLVRRAFQLGLTISGTAVGSRLTLPHGPEREAQIAMVRTWIDRSVDLGAPCVRIFAGEVPDGLDHAQARAQAVEGIRECAAYAAERGVMLGLENHGGITATPKQVLGIINDVDSDWVGLQLDTGNFHSSDPYADVAECADRAIVVHMKTEMIYMGLRQPADLVRITEILRRVGYRGFVNLEYEAAEDARTAVPAALEQMRTIIDRTVVA